MGQGLHLFLVLTGFGGLLGVLFVLNAIGGVVLAIAMIARAAPAPALSERSQPADGGRVCSRWYLR